MSETFENEGYKFGRGRKINEKNHQSQFAPRIWCNLKRKTRNTVTKIIQNRVLC